MPSLQLAFTYQARNSRSKLVEGLVYSSSRPLALASLKRSSLQPIRLNLAIEATIKGWAGREFDVTQLARFYKTLGRRVTNGKPLVEGLDAALEYIDDTRLKQAILMMRQAIIDGQNEFQAMSSAGFPYRDAMIIRSTAAAGKTGDTFQQLATEITRSNDLRKSVVAIFRMPVIMALMMYVMFLGAIMFIAPATTKFLKSLSLKTRLNAYTQNYFDFAAWFNDNLIIGLTIYAAVPIGLVFFFRSQTFKNSLDRLRRVRLISVKSDQATLWNSFALLYDAAIPLKEACKILAEAARRQDSRLAFLRMGKLIEAGRSVEEAVSLSGFPPFIVSGVKSAMSSGNVVAGIRDLVLSLEEDVMTMTDLLKENIKLGSVLLMGVGIALLFSVTYMPVVQSVVSNL